MFVPLSFGEDGASFEVPEDLDGGWLVLRKSTEGRGRPSVVHHRNGKPLVIPLGATHDDLLAMAGKGRYRLQIVDRDGRKLEGVPAAHTGMLGVTAYPVGEGEEFELGPDDGEDGFQLGASPVAAPRRSASSDPVVMHMCSMFGQVVGQMVPMMNACTEIVNTVARVGLLGQAAIAQDVPAPVAPVAAPVSEGASVLQTVMASLMPMLNQLCMALAMRGAAPAAPAAPMPSPVAPMPSPVASAQPRPAPRSAPPTMPSERHQSAAHTSPAGAAPSDPLGAAPAEIPVEMQMRLGVQLRQVLAELTPEEQQLAGQLVMGLPPDARNALLLELVHLSIPEAVARARAILASASAPPPAGTPPTGSA